MTTITLTLESGEKIEVAPHPEGGYVDQHGDRWVIIGAKVGKR